MTFGNNPGALEGLESKQGEKKRVINTMGYQHRFSIWTGVYLKPLNF